MTRTKMIAFAVLFILFKGAMTLLNYSFAETVYGLIVFPFGLYVLAYKSQFKDVLDDLSVVLLNYVAIKIDIGLWIHTKPEFPNLDELNASLSSLRDNLTTLLFNAMVIWFLWIN